MDDLERQQAIEQLGKAILELVNTGTDTIADDLWTACAAAGAAIRMTDRFAVPVVRTPVNLETLLNQDRGSRRYDAFRSFLLDS